MAMTTVMKAAHVGIYVFGTSIDSNEHHNF